MPTDLNNVCCNYTPALIPVLDCPFEEGQVLRLGIQQKQDIPSFPTSTDLIDSADWDTLLASAAGAKRIFMTPLSPDGKTGFFDFKIEAGAPITQGGGDDTTQGGVQATVDYELSKWMLTGYSLPPAVVLELKGLLRCGKSLTMYMVNSSSQIIARKNGTAYEGFVITNMQVPDKSMNGYRNRTSLVLSGYIEKNYDTLEYITPPTTFALTMLNT